MLKYKPFSSCCDLCVLQESSLPVSWSSLVVISNVPDTVTGSSEVQKLVRRFGTVIKSLVLNSVVRTALCADANVGSLTLSCILGLKLRVSLTSLYAVDVSCLCFPGHL